MRGLRGVPLFHLRQQPRPSSRTEAEVSGRGRRIRTDHEGVVGGDPRRTPVGGRRWTRRRRARSYLRRRGSVSQARTFAPSSPQARRVRADEGVRPREDAMPLPKPRAGTPDAPARGEGSHGETEGEEIAVDAPSPPLRAATAKPRWRRPVVLPPRLPDPRSGCTSVRRVPAAPRRRRRPPRAPPPRAPFA